jgi:two-component system, sporulation sensor kinase A
MANQRQPISHQSEPNNILLELQSILENIDRGFMSVNRNWCITYVNTRAANDVRRKPNELLGKNFWSEFPELKGTNTAEMCRKAMDERCAGEIEDYSALTGCWNQEKVYSTANGIVIAWADITQRKQIEEDLRESKERFSTAFSDNSAAMAISNVDGQIVDVNDRFERLLGYAKGDMIGKVGCDIGLYSPSERNRLIEQLDETGSVSNFEMTFQHKSGKQINVIFSLKPITLNKETYSLGTAIDNTERKKAEEAHTASEERLQNIINAMDDGIVLIGLDGRVIDCNDATLKQLNVKREEIIDQVIMDFIFSKDKDNFIKETQDELRKTGKTRVETQALGKNKSPLPVEICLTRFYDKDKKPIGLLGVARDITERKKAEKALKEVEEKFRGLVESTSDIIWQVDEKAVYTYVSPKIKDILGYKPEEIVGKTPFDLIDEKDENRILAAFLEIANKKEPFHGLENCNIHKNGSRVILETNGVPILDEKGKLAGYRGIDRDITERKKLQHELEDYTKDLEKIVEKRTKQLKEKERLAAIGQTAGMVGHDIRNPLQAMTGDLYLIKEESKDLTDVDKKTAILNSVESLEENIFYVNKIVSDLQDYTRPIAPNRKDTNIEALIKTVVETIKIPQEIQTKVIVSSGCTAETDQDYLRRILTNLVLNAIQAMPGGGILGIEAINLKNETVIAVEDNGVGISSNVKEKLFTPLFTTKAKGQGLGLAVVKRLVEGLNGTIRVESEEGKGTKFIVKLPINQSK